MIPCLAICLKMIMSPSQIIVALVVSVRSVTDCCCLGGIRAFVYRSIQNLSAIVLSEERFAPSTKT